MDTYLIKQYHEILSSPNHHGDIINFSDEEFGKYQSTIRYMIQHGYLQDLEIDNCHAFHKTPAFSYFEEQVTELMKESKNNMAPTINVEIGGDVSDSTIAVGSQIQQTEKQKPKEKNWIEKYVIPIIGAIGEAIGALISHL